MYEQLVLRLTKSLGTEAVLRNEPMKKHTTFRIGGPVDVMVLVKNEEELQQALRACEEEHLTADVIGNGSNLLVSDEGIRGIVIVLQGNALSYEVLQETDEEVLVRVFAGAILSSFSREMTKCGYVGMEWAAGIPGTIGGAVVMNAGAYGGEIKDVLATASVLNHKGEQRKLTVNELELSYRHSIISEQHLSVVAAVFRLKKGDVNASQQQIDELSVKRREKQPLEYPSAGSTFKRPEGYYAGKLIQDAGLRGYCVGDAKISEKHCGFVINTGKATAVDVLQLITDVRERIWQENAVLMETEVRFLGEWSYLPETIDRRILG